MCSKQRRSIDDFLPDEILGKIFRRCPFESYEILRSVSTRWDQVVDRYVGRVLIVKSGNTFMVDPESNMDRMSIRANYWMTLSAERNLTGNSNSSEPGNGHLEKVEGGNGDVDVIEEVEKLQDISNPESIRKIGFVGQVGLNGYRPLECILSPCKNITSLFLHLSLFCMPKTINNACKKYEAWQVSCCLPHLKELVIDSCGMSSEDSTRLFSFKSTFFALASFLCSQKFAFLEKSVFAVPFMESTEGIVVRALCIFLGRHADSIKSFSYTQKFEISDNEDGKDSESCSDEESYGEDASKHQGDGDRFSGREGRIPFNFSPDINYLSLSQLALSAKELKNVSLEEFYVILVRRQESAPVWKNMLIKQVGMKKCIFVGDKIPLPMGAIQVNASSLVTLRLDIRDGVNLNCFRNCMNLKHLSLCGRNDCDESCNEDEDDSGSLSGSQIYQQPIQLKNANSLPFRLESLEIINLRTHKNDARIIALEQPTLRDLILKNIGWEGSLGLRLCDLAKIYEMRKLDHLCVKASLNMMSYSELEEDESSPPELNLFACVLQSNSFATASKFFLEVWKRQGGLYGTRKLAGNVDIEEDELDIFQVPNKVELPEEEQELDSSSSDSEEEEDGNGEGDRQVGEESEKETVTDEEWQECEESGESEDEEA